MGGGGQVGELELQQWGNGHGKGSACGASALLVVGRAPRRAIARRPVTQVRIASAEK